MPLSAKTLHASGRISDKQMTRLAALRGTRSQPSKMAPFEHKDRDEGAKGNKGIPEVCDYEINDKRVQSKSHMTKGSKAGPERQVPGRKLINDGATQRPKFPASGDVSSRNPKTGNTRMKGGRKQRTGNMYDVPDRNGFR